jgi:transposase
MAIDEVALSDGDLVTVMINRLSKGNKGKLAAVINGTKIGNITSVLSTLPSGVRNRVKEITMDMAGNMASAMADQFPEASQVVDRFHVVRMVQDALQHLRIIHRWEAIDEENKAIEKGRKHNQPYSTPVFHNGDTRKQLLARSRGLLYKLPSAWSHSQSQRAEILFENYPDLKRAYNHTVKFRKLYDVRDKTEIKMAFMDWILEGHQCLSKEFNSTIRTIMINLDRILAFFNNRSTNGPAESFNAQLKNLRFFQRGVNDKTMFLFRLEKLYA